jgi:hypothetical protein
MLLLRRHVGYLLVEAGRGDGQWRHGLAGLNKSIILPFYVKAVERAKCVTNSLD